MYAVSPVHKKRNTDAEEYEPDEYEMCHRKLCFGADPSDSLVIPFCSADIVDRFTHDKIQAWIEASEPEE